MGDWPALVGDTGLAVTEGADASNSKATIVTAAGSSHTKGSYAQLVASTPWATSWVGISFAPESVGSSYWLLDVAVGGAGSEKVVIPNLPVYGIGEQAPFFLFPMQLPSGTRLSARVQSSSANGTVRCEALIFPPSFLSLPGGNLVAAYGVSTANSRGTAVVGGSPAHNKGNYVELTTSTSRESKWLVVCIVGVSTIYSLVDIAVGSGGSEKIIVPNLHTKFAASSGWNTAVWKLPIAIKAGERIAARGQASSGGSTVYASVYCI